MIVDLLRNDLGRVARPGTVTWSDVFDLERYETVWQLTSTVTVDAPVRGGTGRRVPRRSSRAGRSPARPRSGPWRSSPSWRTRLGACTAARSGSSRRRGRGCRAARFGVPIRTVMLDAQTGTAEYGVGGGITWDSRAASEFDEVVAKAKVLTERRPRFDLYETLRHDPDRGLLNLERHLARLRGSAGYFGFRFDEARIATALETELASWHDRAARVRVTLDRRGAVTVEGDGVAALTRARTTRARHGRTRRPVRSHAVPQDLPAAPVRRGGRPPSRRRRRGAQQHPGRGHREHDRQHRRPARRSMGDAGAGLRSAPRCGTGDGPRGRMARSKGWSRSTTSRRAEALALVSDVRGRRDAVLVDG